MPNKKEEDEEDEDIEIIPKPKYNYSSQIQPLRILKRKEIICEPKSHHTKEKSNNEDEEETIHFEQRNESNYTKKLGKKGNTNYQNIEYVVKDKANDKHQKYHSNITNPVNKKYNEPSNQLNQELEEENSQDYNQGSKKKNTFEYMEKDKYKSKGIASFDYVQKQRNQEQSNMQKVEGYDYMKKSSKNWTKRNFNQQDQSIGHRSNEEGTQNFTQPDFKLNKGAKIFIPKDDMQKEQITLFPQYNNNSLMMPIQNPIYYSQYPILIPPIMTQPFESIIPEPSPKLNVNSKEFIPTNRKGKDLTVNKQFNKATPDLSLKKVKSEQSNEIKLNVNCKAYQPKRKAAENEMNNYVNQQMGSSQIGIPLINIPAQNTYQMLSYSEQHVYYPQYY